MLQWHLHRVAFRPLIPDRIWKCWFLWREENRRTRRKTLGARTRTNNKPSPHITLGSGIEPGPHWWEASALTTAPPLLPHVRIDFLTIIGYNTNLQFTYSAGGFIGSVGYRVTSGHRKGHGSNTCHR